MANARRRTQRPTRTASRVAARAVGSAALEREEPRVSSLVDWQSEMQYINKDLRELLIVSIVLFALLFVVGFLL